VVVEAVEVATLRVVEVVTLVEVVVVVVEAAHLGGHQEAFLEVSQGDSLSRLRGALVHDGAEGWKLSS